MATPRYNLTYLEEGQREKEISINEALDIIDGRLGKDMGSFTKATLPVATDNNSAYAIITDGGAGSNETWMVRSNGTNWLYVTAVLGTIVV